MFQHFSSIFTPGKDVGVEPVPITIFFVLFPKKLFSIKNVKNLGVGVSPTFLKKDNYTTDISK